MKVAIMQPYLFPYIGYFQLINAVDRFGIGDDVQFIKGGWINRNRILINQRDEYIILPVNKAPSDLKIFQRYYKNSSFPTDRQKILNKILTAYRKAPQFGNVSTLLNEILNYKNCNISEFNVNQLKIICNYLNINTEIVPSKDFRISEKDDREYNAIHKAKKIGATHYINAINGQTLYHKESFKENGLELSFIKTNDIKYKQLNGSFIQNLSIIDVMMFNPVHEIQRMLNEYTLI